MGLLQCLGEAEEGAVGEIQDFKISRSQDSRFKMSCLGEAEEGAFGGEAVSVDGLFLATPSGVVEVSLVVEARHDEF